jgi:copper transport protein
MMARRLLLLILAALAALTFAPTPAAAHPVLVLAEPASGAMLILPPSKVLLEFSERLEPGYSRLQLLDEGGRVVAETFEVNPVRPVRLLLELGPLPQGRYVAAWRARSAENGQVTEGVISFGVGVPADLAAALPAPGAPGPALAPPDLLAALGRWLALSGAALAAGSPAFGLLVWRPARRAATSREPEAARSGAEGDALMAAALGRLTVGGAVLVAISAPLILLGQALDVTGAGESLLAALPGLLGGTIGLVTAGRLLLAVALAALALDLPSLGEGDARGWWVCLALGALLLLTFPLTGHVVTAGAPAIAAGFLHVVAMALWLGGLPGLLVASSSPRITGSVGPGLMGVVRRFTLVALVAAGVASLSGAAATPALVGSPDLLTKTTYGWALLLKLGFAAALFALVALQMMLVAWRRRPDQLRAGALRPALGLELGLALALLATAATLLSTAPSKAAWEAQLQVGRRLEAQSGGVGMTLWVKSGQAGDTLLALDVADERAGGEPTVTLRLALPGDVASAQELVAEAAEGGRYLARGSLFPVAGAWEVEAIVRRAGLEEVRHRFMVEVGD